MRRLAAQRLTRRRRHEAGAPVDPGFSFANERTFLAWYRTALALIGGGLAAAQVLRPIVSGVRLTVR
jgi:putative membrane protein